MKSVVYILLVSLFCCLQESRAQGISAQVSSKKVQVGVPFEYAVVITVNATNFNPPSFKDFDIISGPNQSSSIQYVNGNMSQQMTISYGLVAKKEGKFTIGPATIMTAGQKLETAPIAIEAVKSGAATGQAEDETKFSNKVSGSDLFIRTSTSKNRCYLGEQILITQKVYSRLQIIGFQKFAQPTYTGFYSQAQESASKGQVAVENIDGINYYTYELFRTVGTANKAGKIILDPVEGEVVIRRQSQAKPRTVFEQFFGAPSYEDVPVNAKSRGLSIEVLPLPEKNRPANFSGGVGELNIKIQTNRSELKANDAFNLKVTISGKGNIKLLEAPKYEFPESFEIYEPKITESLNSKTFDYLIIPRSEGDYVLDHFDFSYFNLNSKDYVTLASPQIKIKVLPADANSGGAQVFNPQSQIRELENDIRYIKKGDFLLQKSGREFFNSFVHLLLLALISIAFVTSIIVRKTYLKQNSNLVVVKERKAAQIAKKQLRRAENFVVENNKDAFYTEILLALNNYLGHKLNIPVAILSKERVKENLANRNVNSVLLNKVLETLSTSEFAKYAPGAVSGDLQSVYANTSQLIIELEHELNTKKNYEKVA
jgi:hypothetical protein